MKNWFFSVEKDGRWKVKLSAVIPAVIITFLILILIGVSSANDKTTSALELENSELSTKITTANKEIAALTNLNKDLDKQIAEESKHVTEIETEYAAYKKKMKPYEELEKAEAEAKAEDLKKKTEEEKAEKERIAAEEKAEKERIDAEKKAAKEKAEAEAKALKEAEIARGYNTGITYDQLARTPDDYKGEKIKFYGKAVQVMEGNDTTAVRLAVDDNYDTILYCEVPKSLTKNNRILEDDYITLSGVSYGLFTYSATIGGEITIPSMIVDVIDR